MSADPADLSNLADLALPAPVPFWPPAAGVWIVAGMAGAMLAVAGWRALRRFWADAYLRSAAAELDALAASGKPDTAAAVSAILKRAALVAYGREQVASLTGGAWAAFLVRTAPAGTPTDAFPVELGHVFSGQDRAQTGGQTDLVAEAKAWLRGQRGRAVARSG
ncbi:hypothetical protein B6S44_03190 [Bosea sp. Tri-44]|uniref:DUF4381 domain-containing protein n=1 Tax=Bosea sp. Tri-44 TaxID=1972137 RepID=UPI00100F6578|nr:DUF4381 domain-containing protein [Bosea sp. Tri-44]RXT57437.1 hypothetical protein B6S44_03190 [Bosea sp. Tri-44]